MYDTIVVGGGHNGLTCAAYLARGGQNVMVVEARDTVGGLCWTMDMPNAPGYKVNPCGLEFLHTGVEPSVDHELGLHRYGLGWEYRRHSPPGRRPAPHGVEGPGQDRRGDPQVLPP